jgi:GT2 family glycosyltransferase
VPEPRLSVVLSTIGMHDVLRRVLDGFGRQDLPPTEFELVLAVDAAEADVAAVEEAAGERAYPVRLVRGARPGLSANRNAGRRKARAPIVLFTDNDTVPHPDLLSQHLAWHERHPEHETAVLGLVRWAPEVEVTTFMRWLDRGTQFDYENIQGTEAGWGRFYGANVSVKGAFAERVGDFDEEHLPYGYEDLDWAYRASDLGLRVLFNRRAVVDHHREMTLEFWKRRAARVAVSEREFSRLHPELEPWFHRRFTDAIVQPPASSRGLRLAPYVPPWVPVVGPRVWHSVDLSYRQALAPHFLAAWDSGRAEGPDLSEREAEAQ